MFLMMGLETTHLWPSHYLHTDTHTHTPLWLTVELILCLSPHCPSSASETSAPPVCSLSTATESLITCSRMRSHILYVWMFHFQLQYVNCSTTRLPPLSVWLAPKLLTHLNYFSTKNKAAGFHNKPSKD